MGACYGGRRIARCSSVEHYPHSLELMNALPHLHHCTLYVIFAFYLYHDFVFSALSVLLFFLVHTLFCMPYFYVLFDGMI